MYGMTTCTHPVFSFARPSRILHKPIPCIFLVRVGGASWIISSAKFYTDRQETDDRLRILVDMTDASNMRVTTEEFIDDEWLNVGDFVDDAIPP